MERGRSFLAAQERTKEGCVEGVWYAFKERYLYRLREVLLRKTRRLKRCFASARFARTALRECFFVWYAPSRSALGMQLLFRPERRARGGVQNFSYYLQLPAREARRRVASSLGSVAPHLPPRSEIVPYVLSPKKLQNRFLVLFDSKSTRLPTPFPYTCRILDCNRITPHPRRRCRSPAHPRR